MGFFSDQKSSPTRGWAFVTTGLYFLLPVMRTKLQVLAGSGGMICSLVDPCPFGDTGIEPAELNSGVEEDASGLTFQEWTPDVDTSRPPVAMLMNSSEWRAAGYKLKEVLPPALESAVRVRTRGAGLRSLEGMGPKRFVLSVDDDTEFRSRCE
jgi:hypothetical protein